jgi:predicted nucleic acid-binding protein
MMRILLDTDVVLDYLLDRAPFAAPASAIWQASEQGRLEIFVSAITPINVFYIALRGIGRSALATEANCWLEYALRIRTYDEPCRKGFLCDACSHCTTARRLLR